LHVAQRFELFLASYRCPDGTPWTGQKLDEATGGVVTRSYVTNLRKGRIENPGYEKMMAIARAMGFPPALWFEDAPVPAVARVEGQDFAPAGRKPLRGGARHPGTGEPHTNADVARMSAGLARWSLGEQTGAQAPKTSSASYALSRPWAQNSSNRPSSSRTSKARYSGCPKRCSIVPNIPRRSGRLSVSKTLTLAPIGASCDCKELPPYP
jgi:transcriptional regulator with XRE-family HTH domain